MGYKLGAVEHRFKFTNTKDGREVEAISTPAAFIKADSWADRINATGEHTPEYAITWLGHIIAAYTMRHEGLVQFAEPRNIEALQVAVAEALNEWDYEMLEAAEPAESDEPDPLASDLGDAPAPAEGQ